MISLHRLLAVSVVVAMIGSQVAMAELAIEFGNGETNFTAEIGNQVIVPIFVSQTGSSTQVSEGGILSYGLSGSFNGELGQVSLEDTTNFDFATINSVDNAAGSFELAGSAFLADPVVSADGRGRLGTLTYTPTNFGSNVFTIGQRSDFADFTGGNPPGALDDVIFAGDRSFSFAVTVTAVPEPGTMSALTVVTIGGVVARRRKRKSTITADAAI